MYPLITNFAGTGIDVRTYSLLLVIAAVGGTALAVPRLRRVPGMDRASLVRILAWCLAGAWLGGRIHHLSNLGMFGWRRIVVDGHWQELFGVSFHAGGAVLGLVLTAVIVTARRGLSIGRFGDAIVPGFGFGLAVGRFACFLNGCCTGTTCDHLWCVAYPKPTNVWNYHVFRGLVPNDATWSAPVHPLPLYFTAVGIVILILGYALDRSRRYDGESALIALAVFSASNVVLEPFRGYAPLRRFWLGVPQLTWVALLMTLVTVGTLLYCEWRRRRVAPHAIGTVA